MSFLKKKRFKFATDIILADLSDVPFVNAVLFAKVRLLEGGRYVETSQRVSVTSHTICWDESFKFVCKIGANQEGILEQCLCRVSIRRESRGGRSFQKLGFVDINLAEFAGSGTDGLKRSYLLEGYGSSQHGQDNSRLRVNISMSLQSTDPCFKVPNPLTPSEQLDPVRKGPSKPSPGDTSSSGEPDDRNSLNSGSSGFESLPRPTSYHSRQPVITLEEPGVSGVVDEFEPGHNRSLSQTSQPSINSGYGSGGANHNNLNMPNNSHSRQSSCEGQLGMAVPVLGHIRRPSSDIRLPGMEFTRVNPEDFVNELLHNELGSELGMDVDTDKSETSGLQLYICKEDGSAAIGSRGSTLKPGGTYEKVVMPRLSDHETR